MEKYPENKSSPNAVKIKYDFSGIFEKYSDGELVRGLHQWATSPGGAGTPLAAPTWLVGPTCTPSTHSSSHLLLLPPEKIVSQLKPVFLLFLLGFSISLCKAPFTKLFWVNCSLVCDSSIGPISFCSSVLYVAYFCCLGDPVLSFAC